MTQAVRRVLEQSLREAYDVEVRLVDALRDMSRRASDADLAKAFLAHAKVTEKQVERLKKVFKQIGKQPRRRAFEPLDALLSEAKPSDGSDASADLALIRAALVVEQVEVALYKHLMRVAEAEGLNRAVSQLEKNMGEETNAATELEGLIQEIAG
jgi:ferritin-like metal-binding protein YciE